MERIKVHGVTKLKADLQNEAAKTSAVGQGNRSAVPSDGALYRCGTDARKREQAVQLQMSQLVRDDARRRSANVPGVSTGVWFLPSSDRQNTGIVWSVYVAHWCDRSHYREKVRSCNNKEVYLSIRHTVLKGPLAAKFIRTSPACKPEIRMVESCMSVKWSLLVTARRTLKTGCIACG